MFGGYPELIIYFLKIYNFVIKLRFNKLVKLTKLKAPSIVVNSAAVREYSN
jgi:hypothetical protein